MPAKLRVVVSGLIAQHPQLGGITWHYLHYVAGLRRLGHDVHYLEDSGEWPYAIVGGEWAPSDCEPNVTYLADVMDEFGFAGRWSYRSSPDGRWFGVTDRRRTEFLRSADLLVNVSGSLCEPWKYHDVPRRAYIDTDPVFTQLKLTEDDDLKRKVAAHDVHFSFGERLGGLPASSVRWRPTRQPVVLSEWGPAERSRDAFTTVMNWTSHKPLVVGGETFGMKDVELVRFMELPRKLPGSHLEIALPLLEHPDWEAVRGANGDEVGGRRPIAETLTSAGWHVVDAQAACAGVHRYRSYVSSSKAEWTIAKNQYVRRRPAWFSERSACYLAAGRPVITQDTGLAGVIPTGEGILSFSTFAEAVGAVAEVEANYAKHATAAQALAHEYFDSDRVLARLIEECGASTEARVIAP